MKDEEMAEEYYYKNFPVTLNFGEEERKKAVIDGFLAGLKAGRPQWHKITDWKDNSQFPNDELKTYLVRLYQDHYVICEVDITEGCRQFYLSDNLDEIDPEDVISWCEIPTEVFVSWTNQEHKEVCCPYAWKEIVLPELKERE